MPLKSQMWHLQIVYFVQPTAKKPDSSFNVKYCSYDIYFD